MPSKAATHFEEMRARRIEAQAVETPLLRGAQAPAVQPLEPNLSLGTFVSLEFGDDRLQTPPDVYTRTCNVLGHRAGNLGHWRGGHDNSQAARSHGMFEWCGNFRAFQVP